MENFHICSIMFVKLPLSVGAYLSKWVELMLQFELSNDYLI